MARWIDYGRDAWALVFVASFVLSLVAGAIQHFRGKELWESPLIPVLVILHIAWVSALALWIVASAIRWI